MNPEDPAFQYHEYPSSGWDIHHTYNLLTKREYFAALAMQGILANLHTYE